MVIKLVCNILATAFGFRTKRYWEATEIELINFFNSLDVERKTFRLQLKDLLKSEVILKEEIDGNIAGIAGITRYKALPMLIIVVKSEFQRKGIGNRLMKRLQDYATKKYYWIVLSVIKSNKNVIDLYKKFGYEIFHEKNENYYLIYTTDLNRKILTSIFGVVRFFRNKIKNRIIQTS